LQNVVVEDASLLDDEKFSAFLTKIEKDNSKKSVLAYASTLEALSRFIEKGNSNNHQINISSFISMSETLPIGSKEILEKHFLCPVVSRYSNMENGFIAQQITGERDTYVINTGSFLVETFDMEKDIPIGQNMLGRIVITDLFNFAMPLIRYDTGDIGIIAEKEVNNKLQLVLSKVEGRKVDFINDTSGRLVSPHVITNTLWNYSDILQFQFIQINFKEYKMKLNLELSGTYSRIKALDKDLKNYLGDDAEISYEYVNEIPLMASGKRKKIINLMASK
jgi:phenylacetate-CoA ligase